MACEMVWFDGLMESALSGSSVFHTATYSARNPCGVACATTLASEPCKSGSGTIAERDENQPAEFRLAGLKVIACRMARSHLRRHHERLAVFSREKLVGFAVAVESFPLRVHLQ